MIDGDEALPGYPLLELCALAGAIWSAGWFGALTIGLEVFRLPRKARATRAPAEWPAEIPGLID